jgi:hypothetical protein
MTTAKPCAIIFDSNVLWHLAENTTFREISSGREFVVGARANVLWHGSTPCRIDVVEMPVEVKARP